MSTLGRPFAAIGRVMVVVLPVTQGPSVFLHAVDVLETLDQEVDQAAHPRG